MSWSSAIQIFKSHLKAFHCWGKHRVHNALSGRLNVFWPVLSLPEFVRNAGAAAIVHRIEGVDGLGRGSEFEEEM